MYIDWVEGNESNFLFQVTSDFPVIKFTTRGNNPFLHCERVELVAQRQVLSSWTDDNIDLGKAIDAYVLMYRLYSPSTHHPRVANSLRYIMEKVYHFPSQTAHSNGMRAINNIFVQPPPPLPPPQQNVQQVQGEGPQAEG